MAQYYQRWSGEARHNLDGIVGYLIEHWSRKDAANFLEKLDMVFALIFQSPQLFPKTGRGIHRAVVTKQVTLFYKIEGRTVYVLQLFDTRQHPLKGKG